MATVRKIGLLPQWFGSGYPSGGGCIQPISQWPLEFDPSYFIEGELNMVMAIYWRVRAFEVIVNVTHQGSPYSDTFTMRIGAGDAETGGLTKETELVCGFFDWYERTSYGITAFSSELGAAYEPAEDDGSDNYLVAFVINDGEESYRSNYNPDYDFGTNGTWELNFSGYSFTKPLYKVLSNSGPASVVMNAVEYWPYDPGDGGGPIYDSTTGAQLRGFPG